MEVEQPGLELHLYGQKLHTVCQNTNPYYTPVVCYDRARDKKSSKVQPPLSRSLNPSAVERREWAEIKLYKRLLLLPWTNVFEALVGLLLVTSGTTLLSHSSKHKTLG